MTYDNNSCDKFTCAHTVTSTNNCCLTNSHWKMPLSMRSILTLEMIKCGRKVLLRIDELFMSPFRRFSMHVSILKVGGRPAVKKLSFLIEPHQGQSVFFLLLPDYRVSGKIPSNYFIILRFVRFYFSTSQRVHRCSL